MDGKDYDDEEFSEEWWSRTADKADLDSFMEEPVNEITGPANMSSQSAGSNALMNENKSESKSESEVIAPSIMECLPEASDSSTPRPQIRKARKIAGRRRSENHAKRKSVSKIVIISAGPEDISESSESDEVPDSKLVQQTAKFSQCSPDIKMFCEVCSKDYDCEEYKLKLKHKCLTWKSLQIMKTKRNYRKPVNITVKAKFSLQPDIGFESDEEETLQNEAMQNEAMQNQAGENSLERPGEVTPLISVESPVHTQSVHKRQQNDDSDEGQKVSKKLPRRISHHEAAYDSNDDEVDATFKKALDVGIIKLHIVKCGTSGPPGTGKSHVRALMLGLERPSQRSSTDVATEADQVTPDYQRFEEDVVSMKQVKGKCKKSERNIWKKFSDDSMIRAIANTIHSLEYSTAAESKESDVEESESSNSDTENSHTEACLQKDSERFIRGIKKRLKEMKGNRERKRMGLQNICLLYFVDTGGQPQFQEILPNFIKCDINLLIHNLSQELDEIPEFSYVSAGKKFTVPEKMRLSNIEIIEQSIRSITSTKFSRNEKSYVAILGTFKDKCNPDDINEFSKLQKRKGEQLQECIKPYTGIGEGKCEMIVPSRKYTIFTVDGSEEKWEGEHPDLENLKYKVLEYARKREFEVPIRYYLFLQTLKTHARKKRLSFVTLDECIRIASSILTSMTHSDVKKALKLFNDCNIILYFPKILKRLVFTDPTFLYCRVTGLIVASFENDVGISEDHDHFQKTGIFTKIFLKKIVDSKGFETSFTFENFLDLLMGLFIVAKLAPERYFMPCVLPLIKSSNSELNEIKKIMERNEIGGPLMISFVHKMSPRGLFCSFVVALASLPTWTVNTDDKNNFLRRNLMTFKLIEEDEVDGPKHLGEVVIVNQNSHLEVYTNSCHKQECSGIRRSVIKAISKACDCIGYEYKDLYYTGFPCKCGRDDHSTHVEKISNEWKEHCLLDYHKKRPLTPDRLVWFDNNYDSGDEFIKSLLNEIAPNAADKWDIIGAQLLIKSKDLKEIKFNCFDERECLFEVFSRWRDQGRPTFTLETIIAVLNSEIVSEQYLAKQLQGKFC